MRKDVLLGIIIVVAILAALTYLSMQLRAHTCRACVTFNGLTNCATASGTSREEALRTATTTACGSISGGVTQSIQCGNTTPHSVEWID
ncbi:MAG: hypothetical protein VX528_19595 [Candidatus Latescibacterota bacterium]|nr:hypothetical protein [Candidatus Latescibacterota bacterium]MEC8993670.1 hypothetical protein [Candidatus Latescibacterota bacterium]MEC9381182.1 hypothetical protein [Candidatus Latescibacterota bacterium]MEE3039968.1 hypothetical protein [Candidatus Latescibacterota bacterium]MEE3336546.1 hypothetical protein [Candidatus Latescibacterota bacterium]|tara:strand:+ start:77 stop:343 length:267 start_codon:yes stop_codon:yes gene_type:complete